jgi:5-deoxy-glucuronate isomerase
VVDKASYDLDTYDGIYIPRGSAVQISTTSEVDLVEVASDVDGDYPLQVVRYADVKQDPTLKFTTGGPTSKRDLNIILGKNVKAGRIVAGFATATWYSCLLATIRTSRHLGTRSTSSG